MIKLSVSETKWRSLLARTLALILYISIWIFDFGPEKLPGLSRNGPQTSKIPAYTFKSCKYKLNKIDLRIRFCEPARLRNSHKPLFSLKPQDTKRPLGRCCIATKFQTRGPFLESPGNFSGPRSNIQIEMWRVRARVLVSKLLHFVSLTDSFIVLDAKLLKPRSLM